MGRARGEPLAGEPACLSRPTHREVPSRASPAAAVAAAPEAAPTRRCSCFPLRSAAFLFLPLNGSVMFGLTHTCRRSGPVEPVTCVGSWAAGSTAKFSTVRIFHLTQQVSPLTYAAV